MSKSSPGQFQETVAQSHHNKLFHRKLSFEHYIQSDSITITVRKGGRRDCQKFPYSFQTISTSDGRVVVESSCSKLSECLFSCSKWTPHAPPTLVLKPPSHSPDNLLPLSPKPYVSTIKELTFSHDLVRIGLLWWHGKGSTSEDKPTKLPTKRIWTKHLSLRVS